MILKIQIVCVIGLSILQHFKNVTRSRVFVEECLLRLLQRICLKTLPNSRQILFP